LLQENKFGRENFSGVSLRILSPDNVVIQIPALGTMIDGETLRRMVRTWIDKNMKVVAVRQPTVERIEQLAQKILRYA
jgi:hypothetical protein